MADYTTGQLLPIRRDNVTGEYGLAVPGFLRGMLESGVGLGRTLRGEQPMEPGRMLLDTMEFGMLGSPFAKMPAGALGMNVWHGGPNRWAPEPDFPHGRPRLDKIGTGEGAQAYGHGFYSAESDAVASQYRNNIRNIDTGAFDRAGMPPSDWNSANMFAGQYLPQESEKAAAAWGNWTGKEVTPEIKTAFGEAMGGDAMLYKLDLPDEEVAKYLDWDAPLSEQPEVVRDALAKIKNDLPSSALDDLGGDWSLLFGDDVTGSQFINTLEALRGNTTGSGAEDTLRKAGIPGLKYYDGMSRGSGEGTRNYVTWD